MARFTFIAAGSLYQFPNLFKLITPHGLRNGLRLAIRLSQFFTMTPSICYLKVTLKHSIALQFSRLLSVIFMVYQ